MNLPHPHVLEDAEAQLAYAAGAVAPLLDVLASRCETPPANPLHRPRHEQNRALLRGLSAFFAAVDNLTETHGQQVREMREEMGRAQTRYAAMGVERDYCLAQLREANTRYYEQVDLQAHLLVRFAHRVPGAAAAAADYLNIQLPGHVIA